MKGDTDEPEDFQIPDDVDFSTSERIFSEQAVLWAINNFSPYKTAGPDGIFPALLQQGAEIIAPTLRVIFIKCHAYGYTPKSWREADVIYIPKAGKRPSDDPKSVRGISMPSFFLKTMESAIDRYTRDEVLKDYPLHKGQFAYQPGKSTISALQYLTQKIKKTFGQKQFALGSFLDIAGAFDNTSVNSIKAALENKNIDSITCRWICNLLKQREATSTLGHERLTIKVTKGCPKGGVLSPLLWSLVVDSLIEELNANGFFTQGYADDIVILLTGPFSSTISKQMQNALNILARWCRRHGLTVNPDKTEVVLFTRNYKLKGDLVYLRLFGKQLKYSKTNVLKQSQSSSLDL